MAQQKYCSSMTITPQQPVLVASVKGDKIGGNTLYAKMGTSNAPLKPGDPRVNKLVYNMYRGMLNTKHGRANDIVDSAPKQKVCTDEGVQDRVTAMMRQQSSKKEGKMNSPGGPPPPPPPPPFQVPGAVPYTPKPVPVPQEVPAQPTMQEIQTANMPSVLAGAMLKDKKPFTYTPGGLDLSEINEEDVRAQNNSPSGVNVVVVNDAAPIQSKSFKVIQSAYSEPSNDVVNSGYVEPKTYSGSNIPSRSFKVLQAMTDAQGRPVS